LEATFGRLLSEAGIKPDEATVRDFAHVFRKESIILLKEKPYTRQVLDAVRSAGCALGLISNTEELLTDYDLDQLHLKPLFDLICLSSQAGIRKPDPRIFTIALKRIGVKSNEAVFVGDDFEADVRGATDAGLDAVFLSNDERLLKDGSAVMNSFVVQCKADAPSITDALRSLGVGTRVQ
jgi:putative hydrolase of the HAD superfamily